MAKEKTVKPKVVITAIIAIAALEGIALFQGIDGTALTLVIAPTT